MESIQNHGEVNRKMGNSALMNHSVYGFFFMVESLQNFSMFSGLLIAGKLSCCNGDFIFLGKNLVSVIMLVYKYTQTHTQVS